MTGVEDDIASWLIALAVWVFVWFRTVRWYREGAVAMPIARGVRYTSYVCMTQCVTFIGLYSLVFYEVRYPAWILWIIPAFVVVQAVFVLRSGSWMYDSRYHVRKAEDDEGEAG